MNTIETMIREHGGLKAVQRNYLRLENPPFMRLVVEVIGGPWKQGEAQVWEISVAHYGELNGDAMRDPEMCFRVSVQPDDSWLWTPCYFRNDYVGLEQMAEEITAKPKLQRDLQAFALLWDCNLVHQGFLTAFRSLHQPSTLHPQPSHPAHDQP